MRWKVLCSLLLLGSPAAQAATRLVTTGGTDTGDCLSQTCRTIQYAVTQAADGDAIGVGAGAYTETVTITDKSLTITGTDAAAVTVQGRRTGPADTTNVFTIAAGSKRVVLERLTIQHGDIGISATGTVSVRDCILQRNGYDGAPYPTGLSQSELAEFYGAHATDGGAIVLTGGSGGEISGNTIDTNDRALLLTDTSGYLLRNNIIRDNIHAGVELASSSGTGTAGNTDLTIRGNTIQDNRAAGIVLTGGKVVTILGNTIEGNWNAGVMAFHPAQVTIEGNTLDGNNQQTLTGFGTEGEAWGGIATDGATVASPSSFTLKVEGNIVANTGTGRAAAGTGVRSAADVANVEVRGNQFIANAVAVHVLAQAKTVDVHLNNFEQASTGLRNDDTTGSVSAERNWWGCVGGAGAAGCSAAVGSAAVDTPLTTQFSANVRFATKKLALSVDQSAPLHVDGVLLNGNTVTVTPECRFETSDDLVATVDSAGVVQAVSDGVAAVLAACFDGTYATSASVSVGLVSAASAGSALTTAESATASLGDFAFGGGGLRCTLVPRSRPVGMDGHVLLGLLLMVAVGVYLRTRSAFTLDHSGWRRSPRASAETWE